MKGLENKTWWNTARLLSSGGTCLMLAVAAPAWADQSLVTRLPVTTATQTVSTAKPETTAKAGKLSVPPLDHIDYPSTRPDWVSNKPDFSSSHDTIVVVAGPCETKQECIEELRWMQRAVITTYITRLVDSLGGAEFYSLSDEEIADKLVARQYIGQVTQGGSPRYEHAVELRFDPAVKTEINDAWKSVEVGDRLGGLAALVSAGCVLLLCSGGLIGIASRRVSRREP